MLSEREQEAVKGFRVWAKALRDDDVATLRKIERDWYSEEYYRLPPPGQYRKGSF